MTQSNENLSPEMAILVEAGRWTEAEYLEESLVIASVPQPRVELDAVDESQETPETHDCPLDAIDNIQREKAIARGYIAVANEIDAGTLERHASCLRGKGPGIAACARVAELLDAEEQSFDGNDDIDELFS